MNITLLKLPNWQEANWLVFYKLSRGGEIGITKNIDITS